MTLEAVQFREDFSARSPAMKALLARFDGRPDKSGAFPADTMIAACRELIAALETAIWAGDEPDEVLLETYQASFRLLEQLIADHGDDTRHRIVIVIPVADRPLQLRDCLSSLLRLCRLYGYGGMSGGKYRKVAVIIADDTRDPDNVARDREIADDFREQGLDVRYFGLDQQIAAMDALSETERQALRRILGGFDRQDFAHKGCSTMHNVAYLKLGEISREDEKSLFFFIDSDQEFQVLANAPAGDRSLYAVNFFYWLDRIFSETDALMLTGKVVGDPPVSPAVMAGNFLDDVIAFVGQMAAAGPEAPCVCHGIAPRRQGEASYHDMAALFGFAGGGEAHSYRCTLHGEHDNARCFADFAGKLKRFFYGEHPTRKTYYQPEDVMAGVRPARTVYPGNHVFRPEALDYFIPFAALKLRMSGPTLGRIVKAEIGARFVSANLPMLHKRTQADTGQSEFRPGVQAETAIIDLSGEFERQFYGDVMLFTIEKLAARGYPVQPIAPEIIASELDATHAGLLRQYAETRRQVLDKLETLAALLNARQNWWSQPAHAAAFAEFQAFIANIARNFSTEVSERIHAPAHFARRRGEILEAIDCYIPDRQAWAQVLGRRVPRQAA